MGFIDWFIKNCDDGVEEEKKRYIDDNQNKNTERKHEEGLPVTKEDALHLIDSKWRCEERIKYYNRQKARLQSEPKRD